MPDIHSTPDSWLLQTRQGVSMHVPARVSSLTTYVLLEQEQWFEAEIAFVPRLLARDALVLDVGANHGAYTLALAAYLQCGHVWAFEPTAEPRARLERSVAENGLAGRVTVVPSGLSDHVREAVFTVSEHSELNSLHGESGARETVQLDTLDAFAESHLRGRRVDFVKLDAEGEEGAVLDGASRFFATQSPVVMFEYRHAADMHVELVDRFRGMGYGVFRYLPELELLVEFDPVEDEQTFVLNLFAVPAPMQQALARARLLVRRSDLAAAGPILPATDAATRSPDPLAPYLEALRRTIAGHSERQRPAAERVALLQVARDDLQAALDSGTEAGPEAWALLVHLLHALGQTAGAIGMAGELLHRWPDDVPTTQPVMPPQRADLDLPRTQNDAQWLRLRLAEFIEMRRAHCSYFAPPELERLQAIVAQPDHRPEMDRRLVLNHLRRDLEPPATVLEALAADPTTVNASIWRAVGAAFADGRGAPVPEEPDGALPLLAGLQAGPVHVVDVGASRLGEDREPYATLITAGLATLTGFEPDDQAREELERAFPDRERHRFLPHFVGDGREARFHRTSWFMTSSLLEPNRPVLDAFHDLGRLVQLLDTSAVQTCRLDDVIERGGMDLLKIDVQGAECQVFSGASERLRECLLVWTEVEFVPLYRNQPLFGDVDRALSAAGLQFHSFVGVGQRHLASWPTQAGERRGRQQLLWADAVYLPTLERRNVLDDDRLVRLALLAHAVLHAHDVAHAALLELDRRRGTDVAPRYVSALAA